MSDSLFDQLRARGEGFLTEISNNLMANPAFIEVLKKGIAVKEEVDKRVAEGLKAMSVATRKDLSKLEKRLAEMEAELEFAQGAGDAEAAARARPPDGRARSRRGGEGRRRRPVGCAGTEPAGASCASRRSPTTRRRNGRRSS